MSSVFARAKGSERCGIYVLWFENGDAYIGQAVDVMTRYATHRRTFGDIVRVEFAPCERASLDIYERLTITDVEQRASLRNIMLAGKPGGWGAMERTLEEGVAAYLPWERAHRATAHDEAKDSPLRRFWTLASRPEYNSIRALLGRYVDACIADPVLTAGALWTVTAMPSTGRSKTDFRLFTLSCGVLETLYARSVEIAQGAWAVEAHLNVLASALPESEVPRIPGAELFTTTYKSENVLQIVGPPVSLFDALEIPRIADAAYALSTRLMRRGGRIFTRFHNEPFAYDVLAAAYSAREPS